MRTRVFLPEVKRNRLVTNWVMVRAIQSKPTDGLSSQRVKNFRAALITTLCVAMVSGAGTIVASGSMSNAWLATTAPATQAVVATDATADGIDPITQDPCGFEAPVFIAANEKPSRGDAPSVEGFDSVVSHPMGGILIADYKCASSRSAALIRVRWELANATWQLKQVSRPPLRQSGDF
jgi:hypothetical protein